MSYRLFSSAQKLYQQLKNSQQSDQAFNLEDEIALLATFSEELAQATVQLALKNCKSLNDIEKVVELLKQLENIASAETDDIEELRKLREWFSLLLEQSNEGGPPGGGIPRPPDYLTPPLASSPGPGPTIPGHSSRPKPPMGSGSPGGGIPGPTSGGAGGGIPGPDGDESGGPGGSIP